MADQFETFLAQAVVPESREPDRAFVARVQTAIALDRQLAFERRTLFHRFGAEVIAIAAVAAGLLWLGRAARVADFVAESPAVALAILLFGFALMVMLISRRAVEPSAFESDF